VILHDAGKILHPAELDGGGNAHEPAGERRLVEQGVSVERARICISHARWAEMLVTPEELLVAPADKLWKGVRNAVLEERVVDRVVASLHRDRWATFVELDTLFERSRRRAPRGWSGVVSVHSDPRISGEERQTA
jgi:hypothetical protein